MQAARAVWRRRQAWLEVHPDKRGKIVFIDETGLNTKMARLRGRAPKGQRLVASIPHGHWKRGACDQALGRSRGGLSSKIHMAADAQGRPIRFTVTAGQAHDAPQAIELMEDLAPDAVIADKAYDSDEIREHIESLEAEAVIPPRSNRTNPPAWDKALYKERNKIERMFGKLKHFRRFATRYDRRLCYFQATVAIAAAMIWLQSIVDSA